MLVGKGFKIGTVLSRVTILAALVVQATAVNAQTAQIEEILVTATKKEESLSDIPVAVAVVGGDKINEQGAFSVEEILEFVVNVFATETSGNEKVYIRGIGTYGNSGFEQSVGTFVDGVYRGRGQASRAALLDLARVEVLKGPQNTLFGKNTIAGALNITSASPSDEFEASILGTYEPEFNGWGTQIVVSGPLTDTFRARLALRRDETDGYFENRTVGQDERQESETVARLTLDWDATENLNFVFKWERGEQDTLGRQNEVGIATPVATSIYQTFGDANFQPGIDYVKYQDGSLPGRPPQFDNSEWDLVSVNGTWNIGEFTFRSITGYIDAIADNSLDLDFASVDLIGQQRVEAHEQFTQEFILFSPQGETVEYLAGFFYQDEDLDRPSDLEIYLTGLAPLFAPTPLFPLVQQGLGDITLHRNYFQDSETISAFTQVTFNTSDKLRFQLGARYSEEEKELKKTTIGAAYSVDNYSKFNHTASLPHTGFYDQFLNLARQHTLDGNGFEICDTTVIPDVQQTCSIVPGFDNVRNEDHVTGDVIVQYDYSDSAMFYAKWGVGYKAGGYDEFNLLGSVGSQEFEDETVESFELGAKLTLWENRASMNISVFQSNFEDLQVSVFDGVAGFEVANAAEAVSQGIELDGKVALTDELSMTYALAYLDSTFDSFPGAACHAGQNAAWPGPGPCVSDLGGQNTQFAPEYSGNLSFDYQTTLTGSVDLGLGLDLIYKDDYFTTGDNDPVLVQEAFTKINARVAVMGDDKWSVALLGKNLTDEIVANSPDDIPLGNVGFAGSYFYFLDAPRSYEIQATYRF